MNYNIKLAQNYWASRINNKKQDLASVLYYSEPIIVNQAYDKWEKTIIGNEICQRRYKNILDLPVGIGRWSSNFLPLCEKLYCVDVADEVLSFAHNNLKSAGDKVKYIKSDVCSLSSTTGLKFDLILCTGLFEHLPEDNYLEAVDKFLEMLNDNGEFILVVNNENSVYLQDKNYNNFRGSEQQKNGYFNNITDLKKVVSKIEQKISIKNYSTNPNFSVLRHCLKLNTNTDTRGIETLFQQALEYDVKFFAKKTTPLDVLSDQVVIWSCKT